MPVIINRIHTPISSVSGHVKWRKMLDEEDMYYCEGEGYLLYTGRVACVCVGLHDPIQLI